MPSKSANRNPKVRNAASDFPPSAFRSAALWLLASGLFLLSACSLPIPPAQPDLTRYFVLQANVSAPQAPVRAQSVVVRIGSIEVPAYLRDEPLAVRRGENEIHYLEAARWAEPLDQGLARNLLLGLGAFPGITVRSRPSMADQWDYDLKVQVTACEGVDSRTARFAANWTLTPAPGSSRPPLRGVFSAPDLLWDGHSSASLAAALSEGVAHFCHTLAAALQPPREEQAAPASAGKSDASR